MQLEAGDLVDCMDNERDWYKSTVLASRMVPGANGEPVKQIRVGFRNYHEEGSKTDDAGETFFGWSSKYDIWMGVTEPLVQRLGTLHQ